MAEIVDMYGDNGDEDESVQIVSRPVMTSGVVTEFEINGTKIRTVDPNYVTLLERRLIQTERMISEMRNELTRINNSMRQRRVESEQLQRQLDAKLDRQ